MEFSIASLMILLTSSTMNWFWNTSCGYRNESIINYNILNFWSTTNFFCQIVAFFDLHDFILLSQKYFFWNGLIQKQQNFWRSLAETTSIKLTILLKYCHTKKRWHSLPQKTGIILQKVNAHWSAPNECSLHV